MDDEDSVTAAHLLFCARRIACLYLGCARVYQKVTAGLVQTSETQRRKKKKKKRDPFVSLWWVDVSNANCCRCYTQACAYGTKLKRIGHQGLYTFLTCQRLERSIWLWNETEVVEWLTAQHAWKSTESVFSKTYQSLVFAFFKEKPTQRRRFITAITQKVRFLTTCLF